MCMCVCVYVDSLVGHHYYHHRHIEGGIFFSSLFPNSRKRKNKILQSYIECDIIQNVIVLFVAHDHYSYRHQKNGVK